MQTPAQKALIDLMERDKIRSVYELAKHVSISYDKLNRIKKGNTKSIKNNDMEVLARHFRVPIEVFSTGNIHIKGVTPSHPYNKLPEEIQEFITFYYIFPDNDSYRQIFSPGQDSTKLKARVESSIDAAYKHFVADLQILSHSPGRAESVLNRILEQSYRLQRDKKKFD